MAFPTLYIDTGGHAQGSGSTDTSSPTVSAATGASVSSATVTLAGSPDLSPVPTDGSATIYIADATNATTKIFRIVAVDDGADTVTLDTTTPPAPANDTPPLPTGTISNSAWGIGGRFVHSKTRFEGSMAGGWTAIFNNTPAAAAAPFFTARMRGGGVNGRARLMGKAGVRPVLNSTGNGATITTNGQSLWWFENLELDNDSSGDPAVEGGGQSGVYYNIKISDAGSKGFSVGSQDRVAIIGCEITGCGDGGISPGTNALIIGNYIHDLTNHGIDAGGADPKFLALFNIFDTCSGRAVSLTSTGSTNTDHAVWLLFNTFYGCGNSGLEVADTDTIVHMLGNVFSENGNAAGEFNVEWTAGNAQLIGLHLYNLFFHSGGGGGANLSGLTANATELTSDPQFANPSGGDFTPGAASPLLAAGFPGQFLGGSLGYLDIGAVQRIIGGGGGGAGGARLIGGTIVR